MNTQLPIAQWLTKLIVLPFGRTRWSSRFFVLLDSELRIYKDELTEHLSQTITLDNIRAIFEYEEKSHCFQLNLIDQEKPIVVQCKSESELNKWMRAIENRMVVTQYPKCKTNSVFIDESSIDSEIYRLPTQPLRCTNIDLGLLERRRQKLSPIQTSLLSPVLSGASSCSTTPSPTGAVVGTLPFEFTDQKGSLAPQLLKKRVVPHEKEEEELSPTYLIYKMKFRL
ncbi:hypothetical protein G6F56_012565 [Rhizopus delemar]|nr:hypothetical protein G6F56_012565 [Rhizopus delemar]